MRQIKPGKNQPLRLLSALLAALLGGSVMLCALAGCTSGSAEISSHPVSDITQNTAQKSESDGDTSKQSTSSTTTGASKAGSTTGAQLRALATGAYYYGLPLLLEDALRTWFVNTEKPAANQAPVNQLAFSNGPFLSMHKGMMQSNCDVRLWQVMLDLTDEPMVLNIPSTSLYLYLTVYDGTGEIVTSAVGAGQYLLRVQTDSTKSPAGIADAHILALPAQCFAVIRFVCTGPQDRAMVELLEKDAWLRPLSQMKDEAYQPPAGSYVDDLRFAPKNMVLQEGIESYFNRLNLLLSKREPAQQTEPELTNRWKIIGVGSEENFALSDFSSVSDLLLLSTLPMTAAEQLASMKTEQAQVENGWTLRNGTIPAQCSLIQNALNAVYRPHPDPLNRCAEYRTTIGSDGKELNAINRYRLIIPANLLPKHQLFSVALYKADGNPISTGSDRAIYSPALQKNVNGSITIDISAAKDPDNPNHLTCRAEDFQLVFRIYGCSDEAALRRLKLPVPLQSKVTLHQSPAVTSTPKPTQTIPQPSSTNKAS